MESKTKHRILGVLVILGIVVILLPFFQSGKEVSNDTTIVKAPPFPDQTIQVENSTPEAAQTNMNISNNPAEIQNQEVTGATVPTVPDANDLNAISRPNVVEAQPPGIETEGHHSDETIAADHANAIEPSANSEQSTVVSSASKAGDLQSSTKPKEFNPSPKPIKKLAISNVNSDEENGLVNLKTPAYVIQIGSFKNKANAIRLVNQLRSKGYRAFIQQVSTALGDSTRVFIGPELKRTSARATASRLEHDMHIQGIVISYKPLTL